MPLAWGHTRLLETDWRLITQESHCFSCGSVNIENIIVTTVTALLLLTRKVPAPILVILAIAAGFLV